MIPSPHRFTTSIDSAPYWFIEPTKSEVDWFENNVHSYIRQYYKMIRRGTFIHDHEPIGSSGMTAGELAFYIIKRDHEKRKRRY